MRFECLIFFIVLSLSGCGNQAQVPQQACTLIGCSDGVTVVVTEAPDSPYTVEITLPDGTVLTRRCEGVDGCAQGLFFGEVTAETVLVRVTGEGSASETMVSLEYEQLQPNGPDCPPTCAQARVEVGYQPEA